VAERVHEAVVKTYLDDGLVGHISRDGTAIEAREKPARIAKQATHDTPPKVKRGRPRKDEVRETGIDTHCPAIDAKSTGHTERAA